MNFKRNESSRTFIKGFANRDITRQLGVKLPVDTDERKRQSKRTMRLIQLLRAHGLIAKIPRPRRYRVTFKGLQITAAAVHLTDSTVPFILKLFCPGSA